MKSIDDTLLGITEEEAKKNGYKAYLKNLTNGKCYVIPIGEWCIGRKEDLPLHIPIETDDNYMSRQHAYITLRVNVIGENALYIRDTASRKNSSHVDNYRIENYYDFQLFDGSIVEMGYTKFSVHLNPLND